MVVEVVCEPDEQEKACRWQCSEQGVAEERGKTEAVRLLYKRKGEVAGIRHVQVVPWLVQDCCCAIGC